MDGKTLRNYVNILKETRLEEQRIAALEAKLSRMGPVPAPVVDVVTKGRRGKKPLGTVTIRGIEDYSAQNAIREKIRRRLAVKKYHAANLEEIQSEAEAFVYSITDPEIRLLISLYCLDGKLRTWAEVADAMGGSYTADSCRMLYKRFMQKIVPEN